VATRHLSNDGSGYFSNTTYTYLPPATSTPMFQLGERWQASDSALGDLDGDTDLDLVLVSSPVLQGYQVGYYVGYYNGYTSYYLQEAFYYIPGTRVMTNSGGTLSQLSGATPALTYSTGPYGTIIREDWGGEALALGDLDGDGDLDMVVSRSYPQAYYKFNSSTGYYYLYGDPGSRFLRNDGTGKFANAPSSMAAPYAKTHPNSFDYGQADCVAMGDLDGDGDLDVVLGRNTAGYWTEVSTSSTRLETAIRILRNDSGNLVEATGSFLPDGSWKTGSSNTILSAASVRIGDLDGDDSLDLVVAGTIYGVYNYGNSGYGYYGVVPAGYRVATRVLLNDGSGQFKDYTSSWLPADVNGDYLQSNRALLGDLDGDGLLDLVLTAGFYPYTYYTTYGYNRPVRVFTNQ
jgi:hypothetical protein